MFKKEKNPLITFCSTVPGLNSIEDIRPQPANKFIPDWWKGLPKHDLLGEVPTVRVCPSFPDFFSSGFVIPMWADVMLQYDDLTESWKWIAGRPHSSNPFSVEVHPNTQFIDFVTPTAQGDPGSMVFKFISPWNLITPKGYSVLQLPMFYHFSNDFSVLPGIIHTDTHHELNQQILYHGEGKEIFIRRGTPLVQYIPFKRSKYNITTRDSTVEDLTRFSEVTVNIFSKFPGAGAYKSRHKRMG